MTRRAAGAAAFACVLLAAAAWTGRTSSAAPVMSAPLDGAALFEAKGCATCHAGPDGPARIQGFPDLQAAATWDGRGRPGQSAAEYVAQSIVEPWAVISPAFAGGAGPTGAMPALAVAPAEVQALVAYLVGR